MLKYIMVSKNKHNILGFYNKFINNIKYASR